MGYLACLPIVEDSFDDVQCGLALRLPCCIELSGFATGHLYFGPPVEVSAFQELLGADAKPPGPNVVDKGVGSPVCSTDA